QFSYSLQGLTTTTPVHFNSLKYIENYYLILRQVTTEKKKRFTQLLKLDLHLELTPQLSAYPTNPLVPFKALCANRSCIILRYSTYSAISRKFVRLRCRYKTYAQQ
ncbi:hypothetical protein PPYR_06727, partial [Photinus pyralis]